MDKKFIVTNDTSARDYLLSVGFTQIPTSSGSFYFINDTKKMLTFSNDENIKNKYVLTNMLTF